jgi:hypothetical protein
VGRTYEELRLRPVPDGTLYYISGTLILVGGSFITGKGKFRNDQSHGRGGVNSLGSLGWKGVPEKGFGKRKCVVFSQQKGKHGVRRM